MAVLNGTQMAKLATTPVTLIDGADAGGKVRVFNETVTLATQTTSDTIQIAKLPKGCRFLYGVLNASATLGASATIAIGITGTTGKYRAAATFTTANIPVFFGVNAASGVALTAEETVFITIAVASLPASGTLNVQMYYSVNA